MRRVRVAVLAAMGVFLISASTVLAYQQSAVVRTTDSNTTKSYNWSYPGATGDPAIVYALSLRVAYGTITSSYAVVKSMTWTYSVSSYSRDDVTVTNLQVYDNTSSSPICSLKLTGPGNPGYNLRPGDIHTFYVSCGRTLYFGGGYLQFKALATTADGATNSEEDVHFQSGTPG